MNQFRIIVIAFFILLAGCGNKKKAVSLSGDEPVEITDFIEFFAERPLPVQVYDSILKKKVSDSLLIGQKIFAQFVPDSVLQKTFGKNSKVKIYPLGRVKGSAGENYLFIKTASGGKNQAYILVFDKSQKFAASLPAFRSGQPSSVSQSLVLDKRYTITQTITRKNADATLSEGKEVFVYNADAGTFILIMTEALDDKVTELINPLDTFARTHKYSADYGSGKMNLVSVRDGRKPDRLSFFIHFEKNNGECTGELKGEALWRTPNSAEYKVPGDPCVIKFTFSNSAVTLKESNCGSRRGLKCMFDGSFVRKKEVKPKTTGKTGKKK